MSANFAGAFLGIVVTFGTTAVIDMHARKSMARRAELIAIAHIDNDIMQLEAICEEMQETDSLYRFVYERHPDRLAEISRDTIDLLLSSMMLPQLLLSNQSAEKVLFIADIDRTVTVPAGEPLKTFDYALTEDAARLRIYPDRCLLSITHKASSKTFSIACPLRSDSPDDTPAYPADLTMQGIAPPGHILDHLLIFALSVAAVGKGILLIHASTIRYRGKAVMFLGESGTGKSTHSRMWLENIEGSTLLNDDAPAVRISADSTTAYGTPWSGKTPCYRAEHYPLAALVRIRRAPYNQITRLNTLQAFGAVLPSCLPTLQQDDRMLDILCDALSHMLSAVPVYTLDCLPNADAARVSFEAIFGDARQ